MCLSNKQVSVTIWDADDEKNFVMKKINQAIASAIFTLTMWPYRGDLLSTHCVEEEMAKPITKAHSNCDKCESISDHDLDNT